jgi:hypothetical protein
MSNAKVCDFSRECCCQVSPLQLLSIKNTPHSDFWPHCRPSHAQNPWIIFKTSDDRRTSMLFYQAVIMAAVVIAIYLLAFFFKFKNRKVLVISIIGFITIGGVGLYAIQYYFGNHYYSQEIKADTIEGISLTSDQKKNARKIFSDFSEVNVSAKSADVLGKTYKISSNGTDSTINASIYIYSNSKDADNYFQASQKFYENKSYIPLDTLNSKRKGSGERYLISFIKSQYRDYSDLIYLPSKITYSSDVVIEYENIVILISETANRPVTNKAAVINDIKKRLQIQNS